MIKKCRQLGLGEMQRSSQFSDSAPQHLIRWTSVSSCVSLSTASLIMGSNPR